VVAEIALVRSRGSWVDVDGVVRTRLHTPLAADAVGVVEVNHAVIGPEESRSGTDLHARCALAVVATHHQEGSVRVGKHTGLYVLEPGPVDPEGYVVLALACHCAGMAADAGT